MQVKDVMTRNVISVGADEPVVKAARMMLQNRISGLPVVDAKGELVGVVTEGDFLRRREIGTRASAPEMARIRPRPGPARSGIRSHVGAKSRRDHDARSVDRRRRRLARRRRRSDGTPPRQAAAGHAGRQDGRHCQPRQSDARVGEPVARRTGSGRRRFGDPRRIIAALSKQHWAPHVNVVVKNGVAELWGVVTDERERQALIVATENVAGVEKVHDHLVWVEPMSAWLSFGRGRSQGSDPATRRRILSRASFSNSIPIEAKPTMQRIMQLCVSIASFASVVAILVATTARRRKPPRRCRRQRSGDSFCCAKIVRVATPSARSATAR